MQQVFQGGIHPGYAHQHGATAALFEHLQGDAAGSSGGVWGRLGFHHEGRSKAWAIAASIWLPRSSRDHSSEIISVCRSTNSIRIQALEC